MAKFLITVWPFPGHTHLNMAIAKALGGAGHDVAVCTGERARELFAREGFESFGFRRVRDGEILERLMRERVAAPTIAGLRERSSALRGWLVDSLPDQVADIGAALDRWRPDVVVSDVTMWGAPLILRETRSLPVAISLFMPGCMVPGRDALPWGLGLGRPRGALARAVGAGYRFAYDVASRRFRGVVSNTRRRYGLPPLETDVNSFLGTMPLYLVPSTPEFDFDRSDLPPSVRYVGGLSWNKSSSDPAPAWLADVPRDRPLVHVTEGTMHVGTPLVLRAAAEGLADLPVTVVMTCGRDRDPGTLGLGRLAENVRVERWVPHADLLPRTDVMVTTGGGSTVVAGMTAGVPMVVVPTLWDKPDNAARVAASGAGMRLEPKRCTAEGLRRAVRRVLEDGRFREAARRHAGEFARLGRPERVVGLLEGLAPQSSKVLETAAAASASGRSVSPDVFAPKPHIEAPN